MADICISAELCQKNKPNNLYLITTTAIKVMAGNSTSSCAETDLSSPKPWQWLHQYSWLWVCSRSRRGNRTEVASDDQERAGRAGAGWLYFCLEEPLPCVPGKPAWKISHSDIRGSSQTDSSIPASAASPWLCGPTQESPSSWAQNALLMQGPNVVLNEKYKRAFFNLLQHFVFLNSQSCRFHVRRDEEKNLND